jgi:dCMP deaminase
LSDIWKKNLKDMKDKYKLAFMQMAETFGLTSEAQRLKVGALIVKNDTIIALGTNGQPPGWYTEVCEDENYATLPTVRHAEDAALQKLWKSTETATGSEMFVSHAPCLACSIKIVTAGISKVYYRQQYRSDEGLQYLQSKGIKIEQLGV